MYTYIQKIRNYMQSAQLRMKYKYLNRLIEFYSVINSSCKTASCSELLVADSRNNLFDYLLDEFMIQKTKPVG